MASRIELTNANVLMLPGGPGGREKWHYDVLCPGFALRIEGSRRTFYATGRTIAGHGRKLKVGNVGSITVAAARRAARVVLGALAEGRDPALERRIARRNRRRKAELPLKDFLADALAACESELSIEAWSSYQTSLQNHVMPVLGEKDAKAITTNDLNELHSGVTRDVGPSAADHMRRVLSRLFAWGVKQKIVNSNPVTGSTFNGTKTRERVLTASELERLLAAARSRQDTAGHLIQFLHLTGAEKKLALSAAWDDLDLSHDTWRQPISRRWKKDRNGSNAYKATISRDAVELLRRIKGRSMGRVFPIGTSTLKRAFDDCCNAAGIENAQVSDLRRTMRDAMFRKGKTVAEVAAATTMRPDSSVLARHAAQIQTLQRIEADRTERRAMP